MTSEKHIRTLRVRLCLLENNLIPQARLERHDCVDMWEDERDALQWVLQHWDMSRRVS